MNAKRVDWSIIKAFVDRRGKQCLQGIEHADKYDLIAVDGVLILTCELRKDSSDTTDLDDYEANYKPSANQILAPSTTDNRRLNAVNRIPPGYTVCNTGRGDNITTGAYGAGTRLILDANTPTIDFQMLGHWYGIGGKVIWESASLDDYCDAMLIASASSGFTQATGDFNKVNIGGPYNIIVPASPGTGAWSGDLTAKKTNTQILKATPVPSEGNVGFFDYNSTTNVITPNYTQTGGYNLYDFDVNLFRFCNSVHGRKQDGAESVTESSDVVGKLLFNSWFIRFYLTAVTQGVRCGPIVTVGIKRST